MSDCENIPEKALRQKICAGKDIAVLSKDLATIVRNVEIDFDINKASVTLPNIENVSKFLRKMQFYTFIKNIDNILASFTNISDSFIPLNLFSSAQEKDKSIQQSLFMLSIKKNVEELKLKY